MQQSATLIDTLFAGKGSRSLLRDAAIALAAARGFSRSRRRCRCPSTRFR